jgi:hypothetical protein
VPRRREALLLPEVPALRLPELRALVAAVLDEGEEVAVRHREAVDPERADLDLVGRQLVVVGETAALPAHRERAGGHLHHVAIRLAARRQRAAPGGLVRRRGEHLHALQQRLLVLLLVLRDHLVDVAFGDEAWVAAVETVGEHGESALAHPGEVGQQLVAGGQRQRFTRRPRVGDRVEHALEAVFHRRQAAEPLGEPELFEVADVAEVPDHRREDREVLPAERRPVERADELECTGAHVVEPVGNRFHVAAGERQAR